MSSVDLGFVDVRTSSSRELALKVVNGIIPHLDKLEAGFVLAADISHTKGGSDPGEALVAEFAKPFFQQLFKEHRIEAYPSEYMDGRIMAFEFKYLGPDKSELN